MHGRVILDASASYWVALGGQGAWRDCVRVGFCDGHRGDHGCGRNLGKMHNEPGHQDIVVSYEATKPLHTIAAAISPLNFGFVSSRSCERKNEPGKAHVDKLIRLKLGVGNVFHDG